jgi:hypothetical protein
MILETRAEADAAVDSTYVVVSIILIFLFSKRKATCLLLLIGNEH